MTGFFSDVFGIPTQALDDYGALDVSLIADLPLFVDPFLLFNSAKPEYKALHGEIVTYLRFLKSNSDTGVTDGMLKEWYCFKEIRQNWLGYCELGNNGSGLGLGFAKALHRNLGILFENFGEEGVTQGTHLEKVCLIAEGVGKDNISDFATNLIKSFLLEYTHDFAATYLQPDQIKTRSIPRAIFNYELQVWVPKTFNLPFYEGDYIILTPRDMLTKDEGWINQKDLVERFEDIPASVGNDQLRHRVNNYFNIKLYSNGDQEPTASDRREAALETVQKFPWLIDYYIKLKEDTGDQAISVSEEKLMFARIVFGASVREISAMLPREFYASPPSWDLRGGSPEVGLPQTCDRRPRRAPTFLPEREADP